MSTSTTQSTSSSSTSQLGQINKQQLQNSFNSLISNYTSTTPSRIKLIDCFLLFLVVTGILEFAYRVLVTSHPFHAFAGGFGSVIGQFVLLAGLRAQVAPGRDTEFKQVSQERAFADFCAASIVLHVFAYNFLG